MLTVRKHGRILDVMPPHKSSGVLYFEPNADHVRRHEVTALNLLQTSFHVAREGACEYSRTLFRYLRVIWKMSMLLDCYRVENA